MFGAAELTDDIRDSVCWGDGLVIDGGLGPAGVGGCEDVPFTLSLILRGPPPGVCGGGEAAERLWLGPGVTAGEPVLTAWDAPLA